MTTIAISEARAQLPKLVDEVDRHFARITLTKSGKAKAVLMSSDEFASWEETIKIMSDSQAMKAIRQGLHDIKTGKVERWEKVARDLA